MSVALEAVAANLQDLALFLDGASEIAQGLDCEECIILRSNLDELQSQTRAAVTAVENRLLELLDVGQAASVSGHGQVIVEAKGKQHTNGSKLAAHLAARIADTPTNNEGEPLPPSELCALTANELVQVFALNNPSATFRSTELKSRGMRPSEYRDFADGQPRVRWMR